MEKRTELKLSFLLFVASLWLAGGMSAVAQDAPSIPTFTLPPVPQSVRVSHNLGSIAAKQPDFAAEVGRTIRTGTDWLVSAQLNSLTTAEIVSVRLGWAYVLASGLDFHAGEVFNPPGGVGSRGHFDAPAQNAAPQTDAKGMLVFVEQVTLADGTVINADHAKLEAFYKNCCTGANVGKTAANAATAPAATTPQPAVPTPAEAKPIRFDIVSFRLAERPSRGRDMPTDGDFIAYHGSNVDALINFAYGIKKDYFLVSGEPDWVQNEYYEFTAKVAPEDVAAWKAATLTERRVMMQGLLAEYLKLKVHQDSEPHPVFDLVIAKGGPKLMEYQPGDTLTPRQGAPAMSGHVLSWFDPFRLVCQEVSMPELVNSLSGPIRAGRVVIDKTGLTGTYDFWVPVPYRQLPEQFKQAVEDQVPSLAAGLKNVGLQLVPSTGTINGVVIDHIEKPETN